MEHEVLVQSVGGANVISCRALDFYNIELVGEINETDIKKTILKAKYIPEGDDRAKFTVKIIDNTNDDEDFNAKRERESKEMKKSRNRL